MICQLYNSWYRENCIYMLSDQNTAMNWNLSLMTACIIVPWCKIKVLKHRKLYKDAYILKESFAMTDKSYPPPCRNYLQPLYLSVTLYACAQRDVSKCSHIIYHWRFQKKMHKGWCAGNNEKQMISRDLADLSSVQGEDKNLDHWQQMWDLW